MKISGTDDSTIVVLHQMGKVGSTSVWETLRAADLPYPVFKVHYLSPKGVSAGRRAFGTLLGTPGTLPHADAVEELTALLASGTARKWKIISLVRDPVARDISSFVQLVHFKHPYLIQPKIDEGRIAKAAMTHFRLWNEAGSYQCNWFDVEILGQFGIDVFQHRFDPVNKCLRVTASDFELMVLRLEDFSSSLEANLSDFLEVDTGRITSVYASSRHKKKVAPAYGQDVYRQIVQQIKLPQNVIEKVYASRLARHFYTAEELSAFAARWAQS